MRPDQSSTRVGSEHYNPNNSLTTPSSRTSERNLGSVPVRQETYHSQSVAELPRRAQAMAIAIPAARDLFSQVQYALTKRLSSNRIALTQATHAAIEDFRKLADSICTRPTRLAEIAPLDPSVVGAHDASSIGAGGSSLRRTT